ncbi:MAG: hypothetical protein GTO45_27405 [Candidatus Aminicenantes bacterium]|nr:hypothetical protein [Candidatus Aminicenantes bacterium]NIM82527.1 hypothetical protein [Candidatus Aminicenantes bacterium]NIN21885.1 hypothetical protein [Candidatus Aminicenantes bacterium]NIN45663.1 hypothetical protein [Candidatus Aminicenantes bacterium]NIN88496.1 hypothetical protein [Candidatus Aminicenantes bacterium]
MCGIVGIVDFDSPVDVQRVRHMSNIIAYRGPDGEGYWHNRYAALGSRRLAIVDVEKGVQPTRNEDDMIYVVFNGEIYNHRKLRSDLASRGHHFRSHSDTEVLPHLYEELGLEFVRELDGIFAIALWDCRRNLLVLARDRVGVKPLFYHLKGRRLIFASEVKGILASGKCDIAVDPQGLSDCFFYSHPLFPSTFWSGVRDMEPGTVLTLSREGVSQERYFTPMKRLNHDRPLLRGGEAIKAFEKIFIQAVRKRLPDEVIFGVRQV